MPLQHGDGMTEPNKKQRMRSSFTWLRDLVYAVCAVLVMLVIMAMLGSPHDFD